MSVWDNFDKLKDALGGHDEGVPTGESKGQEDHGIRCEAKEVKEVQKEERWSDRIKDVLDGDSERSRKEEEDLKLRVEREKDEARKHIEEERGLLGKVQDIVDHGTHKHEMEEAEFAKIEARAELDRKEASGIRGKLMDLLDPKVGDKVKELWGKQTEEDVVVKEEGFTDKVHDLLHGDEVNVTQKDKQRGWLSEKLNEMAGGGKKSELSEDELDKAVDFFQEYILRQGDQSDESAIDQMKDEEIADGIKMAYYNVTGHDLPIE